MIAQWMLGALLFSGLCAVAAFALERGLRALGRPSRAPWAVALTIATLWPVAAPAILSPVHQPVSADVVMGRAVPVANIPTVFTMIPPRWIEQLDPMLLTLWIAASVLLALQIVLALRTLRRVRRRARSMRVNDEQVLVDDRLGPAVIGLNHPTIVIPAWLLDMDEPIRTLVLRHEREHCRAHDSRLVWLAVATTTLLPWNAALWWMARRLRDAMEIDCDARTLRHRDDRTLYARVLLLIAQQKSSARFAPLLSSSTAQLHRRIQVMHATPPRHPFIRATLATLSALVAVATACSSRVASNLVSPTPAPVANNESAPVSLPPSTVTPAGNTFADGPASMLPTSRGPVFPEALKAGGISGSVQAQFVVNSDGSVDTATLKVLRATDPAFAAAVRGGLSSLRYLPARVGGRAVRQLVEQGFEFDIAAAGVAAMPRPERPLSLSRTPTDAATSQQKPYFDFQVEVPATLRTGQGPQYPSALREAGVQGQVLVQFVVDSTGSVDMRTFKVLKSDHELFSEATRAALAGMRFAPATVGGKQVSQLLQTPFKFSLNR